MEIPHSIPVIGRTLPYNPKSKPLPEYISIEDPLTDRERLFWLCVGLAIALLAIAIPILLSLPGINLVGTLVFASGLLTIVKAWVGFRGWFWEFKRYW